MFIIEIPLWFLIFSINILVFILEDYTFLFGLIKIIWSGTKFVIKIFGQLFTPSSTNPSIASSSDSFNSPTNISMECPRESLEKEIDPYVEWSNLFQDYNPFPREDLDTIKLVAAFIDWMLSDQFNRYRICGRAMERLNRLSNFVRDEVDEKFFKILMDIKSAHQMTGRFRQRLRHVPNMESVQMCLWMTENRWMETVVDSLKAKFNKIDPFVVPSCDPCYDKCPDLLFDCFENFSFGLIHFDRIRDEFELRQYLVQELIGNGKSLIFIPSTAPRIVNKWEEVFDLHLYNGYHHLIKIFFQNWKPNYQRNLIDISEPFFDRPTVNSEISMIIFDNLNPPRKFDYKNYPNLKYVIFIDVEPNICFMSDKLSPVKPGNIFYRIVFNSGVVCPPITHEIITFDTQLLSARFPGSSRIYSIDCVYTYMHRFINTSIAGDIMSGDDWRNFQIVFCKINSPCKYCGSVLWRNKIYISPFTYEVMCVDCFLLEMQYDNFLVLEMGYHLERHVNDPNNTIVICNSFTKSPISFDYTSFKNAKRFKSKTSGKNIFEYSTYIVMLTNLVTEREMNSLMHTISLKKNPVTIYTWKENVIPSVAEYWKMLVRSYQGKYKLSTALKMR